MKRLVSLLLALVLAVGMFAVTVSADETDTGTTENDGALTTSDECIAMIKQMEGFCRYPVWDYAQYTVGYGTRCPDDMLSYYSTHGITEAQAENLLRNFLDSFEKEINEKLIQRYDLELNQHQFDALVSFSYNCGTAWMYSSSGTFFKAIVNGATGNDLVRAFALWCSAGDEVQLFLIRRRLSEANMYLNGIYDQAPPKEYCYVLYNANGGVTSPRTQGYSTEWAASPYPVPTYESYTFTGWYTKRTGGTKVTSLDASHNGTTLYAHWVDKNGNAPSQTKGPWEVTVTGKDVNLRKGPGTNYTKIGTADKGTVLTITETVDAGGYSWGNYGDGWIALRYTDFEEVVNGGTTGGTTGGNDQTTPEPEEQFPITGTINVNISLNIREKAGTGYKVVGTLKAKEKVQILETKMVGATKWGRIDKGWISMDYVIMEEDNDDQQTNTPDPTPEPENPDTTPEPENPDTTPEPENPDTTDKVYTGTIVNCSVSVRIRTGPSVNDDIAGYVNKGTKVTFTEIKKMPLGYWGKMSEGWVSLDYVKLDQPLEEDNNTETDKETSTDKEETPKTTWGTIVNINEWLRIRSGPSTSSAIAGYLKPNDRVEILETKTVGNIKWGKISEGWISMAYVKLDSDQSSGNQNTQQPDNTEKEEAVWGTITKVNQSVNVRSGPGVSYKLVGTIAKGERVKITERKTVTGTVWGKTDKGWISLYYVELDDNAAQANKTYTVIADRLNIRSGPSTDNAIVSWVDYGAKVTVTEVKTNDQGERWGKISGGWVSMDYLK